MRTILLVLILSACTTLSTISPINKTVRPESLPFKSLFPKQEWTDHALASVRASKLVTITPKDAKEFCPNGMTERNWVHLLASMVKHESNFNPTLEYKENFTNNGKPVISTGLFQISLDSSNRYGCGFKTHAEVKDPIKNISCSVKIIEWWLERDGVIAQKGSGKTPWLGSARYWAVLRQPKVDTKTKATLKKLCE